MDNQSQLISLTKQLLTYLSVITDRYALAREQGKPGDFYQEVKPFADEVKKINDQWKSEAINWIHLNRPKNLYQQQIDSAHEHIESVSVQAFFPETSKSRFINLVSSSTYVLNQIIEIFNKEIGPPDL